MKKREPKKKLRDKQQAFINAYLRCLNASEAARLAGYSPKTAAAIGWENLRKPEIRDEIERRLSEMAMGADEVLARLTQQARGSFAPFITSEGHVDLNTPEAQAQIGLLKKVKVKERHYGKDEPVIEYETEIELLDPQAALRDLGRYHKLFVDRTRVETWEDELADLVKTGQATLDEIGVEFGETVAAKIAVRVGVLRCQDGAAAPESEGGQPLPA